MNDTRHGTIARLIEAAQAATLERLATEIIEGPDPAEFSVHVRLAFVRDPDLDESPLEWAAFGTLYTLAALAFAEARPRGYSETEYREADAFTPSDLLDHLRYVNGELHVTLDYLRGRRVKTDLVIRPDAEVSIRTVGRGKAALQWLDRLGGGAGLRIVDS